MIGPAYVFYMRPSLFLATLLKKSSRRSRRMSLFPNEDNLTREIESWKGFAESLRKDEDRKLFSEMLNECVSTF
jgi:hypothetical protein